MPIEFQCSACQTVLRTPDGSQGKSARCPGCSNVQLVPGGSSGQDSDIPDAIQVGAPARHNPYAKPTSYIGPVGNPYAPAGVPAFQGMNASRAKSRVQPAAITWLVVSILLCLMLLLVVVSGIVNIATERALPGDIVALFAWVVLLLLALMGVVGSISMLRMRNRKLAISGAICTMLNQAGGNLIGCLGCWA